MGQEFRNSPGHYASLMYVYVCMCALMHCTIAVVAHLLRLGLRPAIGVMVR